MLVNMGGFFIRHLLMTLTDTYNTESFPPCSHIRSTRDSSCFTVVLNNLRVFLIFDWLKLVRDFLRMPAEDGAGAPPRQRWPSGNSDPGTAGAVMPKTVKSGVVTKRSTVTVTQERYLEVKVNVTGERRHTGLD